MILNFQNYLILAQIILLFITAPIGENPKDVTVGGEKPQPSGDFSPVQVPQLDLAAFDESEDGLKFNNTLEEIELLLNEGSTSPQNRSPQSYSTVSQRSLYDPISSHFPKSPMNIISGSFLTSPSGSNLEPTTITPNKNIAPKRDIISGSSGPGWNKEVTSGKSLIPFRKPTPRKLKSPNKIYRDISPSIKMTQKDDKPLTPAGQFRVPKSIARPKGSVINTKNIVSPVGVYIKYSPRAPLIKHVKAPHENLVVPHQVFKSPLHSSKENKENHDVIPPVVYKPARKKLYTVSENMYLPPSIERMVKPSYIINHEKRINAAGDKYDDVVRRVEGESELTRGSIGDSLLDQLDETNQDVSILARRNAFQK